MSTDIVTALEQLRGRQLTQEEAERIRFVQQSLGIRENDALWSIFVMLDYFQTMYETIPERIETAGKVAVGKVEATAEPIATAAAWQVQQDLARDIGKAVNSVATNTARKALWQWIVGGLVVGAACTLAAGWLSYDRGHQAGRAEGYRDASNEVAASAWGNTPQGQQAYKLAANGTLSLVATCSGRGWQRQGKVCYPTAPQGEGVVGWTLP